MMHGVRSSWGPVAIGGRGEGASRSAGCRTGSEKTESQVSGGGGLKIGDLATVQNGSRRFALSHKLARRFALSQDGYGEEHEERGENDSKRVQSALPFTQILMRGG